MRSEYKHFTRVNQNLALIVEDLRLRQEGLTNEVRKMKDVLQKQDDVKQEFREDLQDMLNKSTTDKKLKLGVIGLHKKWVLDERKQRIEKDSVTEFAQARKIFENGVKTLKEKIQTNSKNHKEKNQRILKDNVDLIDEINRLKMEKHLVGQMIKETGYTTEQLIKVANPKRTRAKSARVGPHSEQHIMELKTDIEMFYNQLQELET